MIQNENILTWMGQDYIIKTTNPKSNNVTLLNDVFATHIMYEFQGHYVPKKEEDNNENESSVIKMYLKDFLEFIFKGNKQGFKYFIHGDFKDKNKNNEKDFSFIKMYLKYFLEFIFKGNKQGFKYFIHGDFKDKKTIESLGDKNGIEALNEGAEIFNFIYYADNKDIHIYDEKS